MNVRLKFKKEGPIKFIGHLDLMRTFQKMFIRAGIPVAYSEGFNPHQIFSFATALAVGVSSEGEYLDLRLTEDVSVEVLIKVINGHAARGIEIVDGVVLKDKEPKAMATITAARYHIGLKGIDITQEQVDEFLTKKEIVIQKKTKKGKLKDVDLRPGIYEITLKGTEGEQPYLEVFIATGSAFNIKPELMLEQLVLSCGMIYERKDYTFHRIELYHDNDGLKPLLETKL